MATVEHLNVALPAEMAEMIRGKVEDGTYASSSEVIREAVRVWQESERISADHLLRLRAEIEDADADPRPALTEADLDRHFADRLARSLVSPNGHA